VVGLLEGVGCGFGLSDLVGAAGLLGGATRLTSELAALTLSRGNRNFLLLVGLLNGVSDDACDVGDNAGAAGISNGAKDTLGVLGDDIFDALDDGDGVGARGVVVGDDGGAGGVLGNNTLDDGDVRGVVAGGDGGIISDDDENVLDDGGGGGGLGDDACDTGNTGGAVSARGVAGDDVFDGGGALV